MHWQESLCETFLGESNDIPDNVPQPYIDSFGLANLLKTLPPKVVCDILLQSFSISVHPVLPLVHFPTLQKDYNSFWQWCRNSDISQPDNKLLGDPTFLCLMFSILYCGALTALPVIWITGNLKGLNKDAVVKQLRDIHSASLKACQHLNYPTTSTLVSSLLAHSCSEADVEPSEDLRFISTAVRIGQSMGLHRDGSLFNLDIINCELHRRIWWHIVWLDVQSSLLHGTHTCCVSEEELKTFSMVSKTRDEDLSQTNQHLLSRSPSPSSGATSVAMLLAIGRFETARFKHFLFTSLEDSRSLVQARLDECISTARSLQAKLDSLIANIPAQGVPEAGSIPSRLANASPMTYERLYGDRSSQPNVWSSWARIMLSMLKSETAILVQKPFLGRADSKTGQQPKMWIRCVKVLSFFGRGPVFLYHHRVHNLQSSSYFKEDVIGK